jgi:tetratricopeptide (TPR) repeat protein
MYRAFFSGIVGIAIALALPTPAVGQSTNGARARELYEEGARLYNMGQYENALRSFEQAYALSGAKPLLFNIAQAHRLAGPLHCERALLAYETYLREDPQASNRVEVEQRIGEMRTCTEREHASQVPAQPPPAPATAQPPPAPATADASKIDAVTPSTDRGPASAPSVAPIVVTGVGGVLFATGGILYWRARVTFDRVKGSCPCPEGQFSGWQTVTSASYGLLAVGGATLVGGVSWWVLDRRKSTASSYGVVVNPGGVSLVGAF